MSEGQQTAAAVGGLQGAIASIASVATKPGYTKTEFWGTAILSLLGAGLTYAQSTPYGMLASSVAMGVYTVARSVVQAKADTGRWSAINDFLNKAIQPANPPAPPGRM